MPREIYPKIGAPLRNTWGNRRVIAAHGMVVPAVAAMSEDGKLRPQCARIIAHNDDGFVARKEKPDMQWLNEAPAWAHDGDTITITAAPKTDFWRITHDGGQRDSGHFYAEQASGDFIVEARFSAEYAALYDQAGLMVRLDAENWLKCGIELFNGVQHASAVLTREYSDWSILPLDPAPPVLWMRVKREGNALEVSYSLDGEAYTMLRQGYFPPQVPVLAGVMVCAPVGDGFTTMFEDFSIRPVT